MCIDKFDRIISTTIIIDSWKSSFIIFLHSAEKRCLSLTAGEKFTLFFPFFFQNPPKYCGATRTFRNFLTLDCLSVSPK